MNPTFIASLALVVVWGGSVLLTPLYLVRRGYDWGKGLLPALLIGPFALIGALLFVQQRERCPACGAFHLRGAFYCPACGAPLNLASGGSLDSEATSGELAQSGTPTEPVAPVNRESVEAAPLLPNEHTRISQPAPQNYVTQPYAPPQPYYYPPYPYPYQREEKRSFPWLFVLFGCAPVLLCAVGGLALFLLLRATDLFCGVPGLPELLNMTTCP